MPRRAHTPEWDRLYQVAAAQEGLFTTQQAAEAGYSLPLLAHHMHAGRIDRVRRGVYRLVHFPAGEHEELVAIWLWSDRAGVFSHETALSLLEVSDALPTDVHLTLPAAWRRRRLRVPEGVVIHHADVADRDRAWVGPVPITSAARTLSDLARSDTSPELLQQAAQQALRRGLTTRDEIDEVARALAPFGGLPS